MDVVIRELTPGDMRESAETVRESFATVAAEFGLTRDNCPTNGAFTQPEHLEEDLRNGCLMYGLYVEDAQIGFAELQRKGPDHFELRKLAVRPASRHHGFGLRLLEYACGVARKSGATYLGLGIIEENGELKNWYLAHGFSHTGTRTFPSLPFTVGFMKYEL